MTLDSERADPATARLALTVSALNRAVAGSLLRNFPLVRVSGEIANFTRAASGHWYFVLKDSAAQVRCVMFRGRNVLVVPPPRDGESVEVLAQVSLYEPRGEFQLSIESLQRSGLGRLYEEFLRLRDRLAAAGWFDAAAKRALPPLPRAIGIVSSLQAAALRDVIVTLQRRAPYARVVVYPAPVQGAGSVARLVEALGRASTRAEVDVVLLVRGGGSIEDLWSFNDEAVARAIRACAVPVVCGVGHETDVTIADLVADRRAPTPTAAAELVAPAAAELRARVAAQQRQLGRCLETALERRRQRVDYATRALSGPRLGLAGARHRLRHAALCLASATVRQVQGRKDRLAGLANRLARRHDPTAAMALEVSARRHRLAAALRALHQRHDARCATLVQALEHLNPLAVLGRGYALVFAADGTIVAGVERLATGDPLSVQLARGRLDVRVDAIQDRTAGADSERDD